MLLFFEAESTAQSFQHSWCILQYSDFHSCHEEKIFVALYSCKLRSSHQKYSLKKSVDRNFIKFPEKHPSLFNQDKKIRGGTNSMHIHILRLDIIYSLKQDYTKKITRLQRIAADFFCKYNKLYINVYQKYNKKYFP